MVFLSWSLPMPPLKFSCRLWLHYPISRWDRPSSAVKSIQRATQSDLDFEKPDFFIDENHEIMDETMDESWIPQRIMRRNLTGMMSFHLGRLGKGQHTPAEKKIEGWSMRLPRNRPGFFSPWKVAMSCKFLGWCVKTMWEGGSPSLPSFARSLSGNLEVFNV